MVSRFHYSFSMYICVCMSLCKSVFKYKERNDSRVREVGRRVGTGQPDSIRHVQQPRNGNIWLLPPQGISSSPHTTAKDHNVCALTHTLSQTLRRLSCPSSHRHLKTFYTSIYLYRIFQKSLSYGGFFHGLILKGKVFLNFPLRCAVRWSFEKLKDLVKKKKNGQLSNRQISEKTFNYEICNRRINSLRFKNDRY